MRVRRPSHLTLLTGALVVLLPALAVLQYVWVGRLSEAERDRMQRNLEHAAHQFCQAFDGEVARAVTNLQVDASVARDEAWPRYADRYAAWSGTAEFPGIVADVFLVDDRDGKLRLRKWSSQARTFSAADWDGPLAAARDAFVAEMAAFDERRRRPLRLPRINDAALIVAPVVRVQLGPPDNGEPHAASLRTFGFTIVRLNLEYIRRDVLPALAHRYFGDAKGFAYDVAVVETDRAGAVVYRSSPDAPVDSRRADMRAPLFEVHRDPIMFFARGARGRPLGRGVRESRNVFIIQEPGPEPPTRPTDETNARWRLLVQDRSGSLETAVGMARQRNLLVSFGILLLMAVSIGLLAETSRHAQRLARQQMEFVAGVSHELRTPVAVIRSAADNLSEGVVDNPDRVRRYGDAIGAEARRLGEMVERVLQFAGIDSGRAAARVPMAVAPIVEEAVAAAAADVRPFTVERAIAADVPAVRADAAALRSAIRNLVANAVKYGGADGWVGVRVTAAGAGRKREVRIAVEDHGGGIAPADLPHIFEPFYRGTDVVARQIHGSGLGLALVRRIAEAHGGRVTVSTSASGTVFTLHLPAAAAAADAIGYPSPNEAAAR